MHASDAQAKKKYSNFDGLSFWQQNGYLLKLIFLYKGQSWHIKFIASEGISTSLFPSRKRNSENYACEYCM